jgi:glycosyltransferase involved in cell wall biosynthesis
MSKDIRVLFIYTDLSTFVQRDLGILRKKYMVKSLKYSGKKDLFTMIWGILTTDLSISWFALGHATSAVFMSKILRKKSIVIAGGWDVKILPEINYGAMLNSDRIRKTKFTLKYADRILSVSNSTKEDVLYWFKESNVETVYLGFDFTRYGPLEKKDLVISVGTICWHNLKVKGIETFVKTAAFLPEITFMLIGPQIDDSIDYLKSIATPNLIFKGYTQNEELSTFFGEAKVYVQVSAQESFGSALAEAMLCGCVPVVTKRGALPEVVGNTGYYADYGNPEITAQKIKEALESTEKRHAARERIKTLYPLWKRKDKISEIIDELCQK